MDHFEYRNGRLHAEDVPVAEIAAAVGTPCYVYSHATIERHWRAFDQAFGDHPHLICYAVKANSNLAVLNVLARLGSGFDIVSVGELERVLAAGGDPGKVVFSGVGKRRDELERALEVEHPLFQRRVRSGTGAVGTGGGGAGAAGAGFPAHQSRRGRQHPSLHFHWPEAEQVWHRRGAGAGGLQPGRRLAASGGGRGGLPHRLATDEGDAVRGRAGAGAGAGGAAGTAGRSDPPSRSRRRAGHPLPRRGAAAARPTMPPR